MDGARRVIARAHGGYAGVEHAGHGEHLEHRAHLVGAGADAVQPVLVERLLAMVRVVVRKRGEAHDLPAMHVDDHAGRGLGAIGNERARQLLAQHVLHAEIKREGDALAPFRGLRMRHGELRIVVDELLDAGEALIVHIHMTDHVTGGGADRIDAAIFLDEAETGKPELVDLGLLLRRQLALDADEAAPGFQLLAQLGGVDVGEHARHLLDQLVAVDDARRIGIEGGALDVGGQQPAVAVEDVRPVHGGGDVVRAAAARLGRGKAHAHQTHADQHEARGKGEARQPIAVAAPRQIDPLGAGVGTCFGSLRRRSCLARLHSAAA